jgi:hypothetical protein
MIFVCIGLCRDDSGHEQKGSNEESSHTL